jgi:phosphoribosylformylglycinamidine (FGAM) synthase PurS component
MTTHQITLEILDPDRHTGEETRAELARRLHAEVGALDEGVLFDLRVEADSREQAFQRVADALAELGVEQHFTFPPTTGTDYLPPGRRGLPHDERPPDEEPPHLQHGSPHEDEPAPYDPPPKEVP